MTSYYDKAYPLACLIDLSNLGKQDQENVIKHLEAQYQAWKIEYPSDGATEMSKEMSKKGYLKFRERPPYTLTSDETVVLFMKCLDRFNPTAELRSSPNTLRVMKSINNEKDFVRIVDDLTIQQDNISISNIWKLADAPSRIAYTTKHNEINRRLCREVIVVPDEYIGKRKFDEKMSELAAGIDSALQSDKLQAQSNFTEGKYRL